MIRTIIIDDEPAVLKIIEYFTEKENLPLDIVARATDGRQGLALIEKLRPELVFIDIQMPVMTGFDVMKAYPDTNYIIVTAFDFFKYAQEAIRLGAKDILLKPIDADKLVESVERVMGYNFTDNKIVNDILKAIHTNYMEDIRLADFSEENYMTKSSLSRLFKKKLGVSFTEYLIELRINKSKALLLKEYTIGEVASMVGYGDQGNYHRKFKELVGLTPNEYRQKNINKAK